MQALARLAGETSTSAAALCSASMRRFIIEVASLTSHYKDRNQMTVFEPEKLVGPLNQKEMKRCILRCGNAAYVFMAKEMDKYRYVNIMIDAATVLNMRIVHSTLSNPFSGFAPLPFRCTPKEGNDWTVEDYTTEISTIITEIISGHCFIPVAICHDRLRAQATAVQNFLKSLARSSNELSGLIADVPCLNHLTNNSFTATISYPAFKAIVDGIEEFAHSIRTREALNVLKRKCPLPPKTRWLYIADTLEFIIRHRKAITEFLRAKGVQGAGLDEEEEQILDDKETTTIPDSVFDLYIIVLPFKLASLCFECEQSRLSDVIPVVRVLQKWLRHVEESKLLRQQESYDFLHCLTAQFFARLKTFLPPETWACWSLTREGRYQLRKKVAGHIVPEESVYDYEDAALKHNEAAFSMKQRLMEAKQWMAEAVEPETGGCVEDLSPAGCDEEMDAEQEEELFAEASISEGPSDERVDETMEGLGDQARLKSELASMEKMTLMQILDFDIMEDAYSLAFDVIKKYFVSIHKDRRWEEAEELFDTWLYRSNFCPSPDLNRESDYEMWRQMTKFDSIKPLACVAFRLITISTSEADVERLISAHRYLTHDRMTNLQPDTLLARLRMRARALTERVLKCREEAHR